MSVGWSGAGVPEVTIVQRLRSVPLAERFWSHVEKVPFETCWLWSGSFRSGYGAISVDGRLRPAHRVAYELECGPIPHGMWVLHQCDNPPCVRPDHLFLGTNSDNQRDSASKGRAYGQREPQRVAAHLPHGAIRGSACSWAVLSESDVREIRGLRGTASQYALAARFGVSRSVICNVLLGKTWRHVQ